MSAVASPTESAHALFRGRCFDLSTSIQHRLPTQVVLLTGEARQLGPRLAAAATQPGGTTGLAALVMACACMGMVLHFSLFLCTMTNR